MPLHPSPLLALTLLLGAGLHTASAEANSDYIVVSPKAGVFTDSSLGGVLGVTVSRYPNYTLGYGIGLHQMYGGPEIEASGKLLLLNVGLSAGPMFCLQGPGLTASAYSSLVYIGMELRVNRVSGHPMEYLASVFIPLWWRNGKFWDLDGAIGRVSFSGYH